MPLPRALTDSFSRFRRFTIGASAALSIASVLALAFMVNYLAAHHAPRFYWGAAGDYQLSPLTKTALASVTNQVRITVFFDRDHSVFPSVRALLREYASASPQLQIEYIDYTLHPTAAQEFRRRAGLTIRNEDPDLVLFESNGHSKVVPARDLREYDTRAIVHGRDALPIAFNGEQRFTSAIIAVGEGRSRKVFFLQGHGEHDLHGDAPQTGYRKFADTLAADNIEILPLNLNGMDDVPKDCELLVLAGPQQLLTAGERQIVDRYLRRGGRLLVLFAHRALSGIELLLAEWGITVGDSLVLDAENSDNGVLIASRFGNHPVTRPLANSRLYLFLPRAVDAQPVANILGAPAQITPLLFTGTNGTVVTTFTGSTTDTGYRLRPDDRRGSIPLAVAVERGSLPGVAASLGTTRIVAVGESTFLANSFAELAANRHFAATAVHWLLDRSQYLGGIQPAPIHTYQVTMTKFQERMLRWILLVVLPGGILAIGTIVWLRRH